MSFLAFPAPEKYCGKRRDDDLAGEGMLLLGDFFRVQNCTVIEITAAEFRPV